jgi:YHS domain-containing protein
MLKLIIFAVAAFVLYKLLTGDKRKKEQDKERDVKKKVAQGELVKDPVCGTYVSLDSDIRVRQGDTVHRFCSYECRDRFLKQIGHTPPSEQSEGSEADSEDHA